MNRAEQRVASRWIPKGSVAVRPKGVNVVVYIGKNAAGRLYATGFAGTAEKPAFNYSFRSAEYRQRFVTEWVDGQRAWANRRAERKANAKAFVPTLKVGDILYCTWGYDQTNVDFFEVVKVVGKCVDIRKIGAESEETGFMSGQCVPVRGMFIDDKVMRKRVLEGNRVRIYSFATAGLYEQREVAPGVKVGRAVSWSSYA